MESLLAKNSILLIDFVSADGTAFLCGIYG